MFGIRLNRSKKWMKENFVCWSNITLWKANRLDKHYGDSAPSIRSVYKWFQIFRSGHMSENIAERSGHPVKATTLPEIIDKVHDILMDDRRVKLRGITRAVGMSKEWVHNIFHQLLDKRKLSARWVPRLLTVAKNEIGCGCKIDRVRIPTRSVSPYSPDLAPSNFSPI